MKTTDEMLWNLKRISANLTRAAANHDFDTVHAEAGRLADVIEEAEAAAARK